MINIVNKKNHIETPYDYYIGRPSPIGNPFTHKPKTRYGEHIVESRDSAIDNYEDWLKYKLLEKDPIIIEELRKISYQYKKDEEINLVCWCYPKRCHGEIIKKWLEDKLFDNDF